MNNLNTVSENTATGQRREFLTKLAGGVALTACAQSLAVNKAFASVVPSDLEQSTKPAVTTHLGGQDLSGPRSLHLFNTHTHHSLNATFYRDGKFDERALQKLNLFLRDHRENEAIVMDKMLFTQLWAIKQVVNPQGTIQIISGYRTPKTNQMLKRRSSGVARNSLHMQGRAIDFRMPGSSTRGVRDVARMLQAGGVGYYSSSDFVHIDTGEMRHWG